MLNEQDIADWLKDAELLTDIGHRAVLNGETILASMPFIIRLLEKWDAERLRAAVATPAVASGWSVATGQMPKGHVLASMLYPNGKRRTIVAFYAGRFTIISGCDDGISFETNEEDEEDEEFYLREGWYECIQNWDEFSSVTVSEGTVTHWMPLPGAPGAAPASTGPCSDDTAKDAALPHEKLACAVHAEVVATIRAYGHKTCADYIDRHHGPGQVIDRLRAALSAAEQGGK